MDKQETKRGLCERARANRKIHRLPLNIDNYSFKRRDQVIKNKQKKNKTKKEKKSRHILL